MKIDKKYPFIYVFIGPEGLSWGKYLGENNPALSQGDGTAVNVKLKNHHAFLFGKRSHTVANIDMDRCYELPILVDGEKEEYMAKVFLHDYYGNKLEGIIPARASILIDQLRKKITRLQGIIDDQAQELHEMQAAFDKKWNKRVTEYKKVRGAVWTPTLTGGME